MISFQLNDDVAYYLAEHIDQNLRRLRGAIMNLVLQSQISGKEVDLDFTKKTVDSMIKMNANKMKFHSKEVIDSIKEDSVINAVALELNLDRKDIFSNSRKKDIALARQLIAYIFKTNFKMKTKDIAEKLDKNHSTIIHSIKKIEQSLLMGNEVIKDSLNNIYIKLEEEKVSMNISS